MYNLHVCIWVGWGPARALHVSMMCTVFLFLLLLLVLIYHHLVSISARRISVVRSFRTDPHSECVCGHRLKLDSRRVDLQCKHTHTHKHTHSHTGPTQARDDDGENFARFGENSIVRRRRSCSLKHARARADLERTLCVRERAVRHANNSHRPTAGRSETQHIREQTVYVLFCGVLRSPRAEHLVEWNMGIVNICTDPTVRQQRHLCLTG